MARGANLVERLVQLRSRPVVGRLAMHLLALQGVEVPPSVRLGAGVRFVHRGWGVVIHPRTTVGDDVLLYPGVVIGDKVPYDAAASALMERIEIGDGAQLMPGCKVLGGPGVTRVGTGTVVGANAVLTTSTGDHEVWAGVPARKVGDRSG